MPRRPALLAVTLAVLTTLAPSSSQAAPAAPSCLSAGVTSRLCSLVVTAGSTAFLPGDTVTAGGRLTRSSARATPPAGFTCRGGASAHHERYTGAFGPVERAPGPGGPQGSAQLDLFSCADGRVDLTWRGTAKRTTPESRWSQEVVFGVRSEGGPPVLRLQWTTSLTSCPAGRPCRTVQEGTADPGGVTAALAVDSERLRTRLQGPFVRHYFDSEGRLQQVEGPRDFAYRLDAALPRRSGNVVLGWRRSDGSTRDVRSVVSGDDHGWQVRRP